MEAKELASIEEVRKERLKEILQGRKSTESRLEEMLREVYNRRKLKSEYAIDKLLMTPEQLREKHGSQTYYKVEKEEE